MVVVLVKMVFYESNTIVGTILINQVVMRFIFLLVNCGKEA